MSAATSERTVFVVDDDEAVRDALGMLFRTAGLRVESFPSAASFLEHPGVQAVGRPANSPDRACCLVLDIRMPDVNGMALHDELLRRGARIPVIFITGHGDIPMAVAAVKKGAHDFIEKPFDESRLLEQVLGAIDRPAAQPDAAGGERLAHLSDREREVLDRVLTGKSSRQIAEELYISAKTVEFHRARIMSKLGVRSAAELFRLCLSV